MICLTYIYYSICVREMQGEILGCLHKFLGAPSSIIFKIPLLPLARAFCYNSLVRLRGGQTAALAERAASAGERQRNRRAREGEPSAPKNLL